MKELENTNTVVDPFSEEAIVASLPLEAQGELKAYGALEDKSASELHDIMMHMRETYRIPPWHPFTYMMKGLAAGDMHGLTSRDKMWAHPKYTQRHYHDPSAKCGEHTWLDTLFLAFDENGKEYDARIYLDPFKKLAWSTIAECSIAGRCITCYSEDGTKYIAYARWSYLYDEAKKILAEGKTSGVIEYRHSTPSESKKRAWETRKRNLACTVAKPRPVCAKKTADEKPKQQSVQKQHSVFENLDKSIWIPVLELAKAKAQELGMSVTVKMLEEALHVR